MFVFSNATSSLATALQSFEQLLYSEWFYLSLAIIAVVAMVSRVLAAFLRKRIDVVATAIWAGLSVQEFQQVDLGYAPPLSPVWDPTLVAARQVASLT